MIIEEFNNLNTKEKDCFLDDYYNFLDELYSNL